MARQPLRRSPRRDSIVFEVSVITALEAARHAFVGTAVTEIASFGAQLSGPQIG